MARTHELRLISRVAQLYYGERLKQAEVSKILHISQASVSRLAAKAIETGIVRVTITNPSGTYPEIEERLRKTYGIEEAIVADCFEDREDVILSAIGAAAAHYFETTIAKGEVIGISSWSATLLRMVDSLSPLRGARAERVVQILGGIGSPSVQSHATQLTARLATLTGAEATLLPAQGVAGSVASRDVMLGDNYVREAMNQFSRVTTAMVGIGALHPSVLLANSGNAFTNGELEDLEQRGAIGDICVRFFDHKGRSVISPLEDRVIGITLEELSKVPRVVGIAGGNRKVAAIHGALLSKTLSVLITDYFTAEKLARLK